jgi:putative phosphoribosyl transferase
MTESATPWASVGRDAPGFVDVDVTIPVGALRLEGRLVVPTGAGGVVVFAHGSGSSRRSPRNALVASVLQGAGLGTLLMDLLEPAEEGDRGLVFDIPELARRLDAASRWLVTRPATSGLRAGWFGASTGAGAALWAAADPDARVEAIVSRGGRPDLAASRLAYVRAPTLLIVGGADLGVLDLNEGARRALRCPAVLEVVPGATHLFEQPGALERVAALARGWFLTHLVDAGERRSPPAP